MNKHLLLSGFFLFFLIHFLAAQKSLHGAVIDETGEPLIGASILTKRGADQVGVTEITFRNEFGKSSLARQIDLAMHHPYVVNPDGTVNYGQVDDDHFDDNEYPQLYDHQSLFFDPGSYMTNTLSIGSRSQSTNYFFSLNNTRQSGVLKIKDGYSRQSARVNVDLQRINKVTGKFVPNEFLRSLGRERITEVRLGDHIQREVTVLFSDIRGYTSLAETMTPEETFAFVNAYNGRMGPIIRNSNGFINQYLGDGIMAIFLESPADALRAAIGMLAELSVYNQKRTAQSRVPIHIGVGIHTGALIMGVTGDQDRMDATTIADTVNSAARIEGLTKHYGANILLSGDSLSKLETGTTDSINSDFPFPPSDFKTRFLGKVQMKGKEQPVDIYECFSGDDPAVVQAKLHSLEAFETALDHYFKRQFGRAAVLFEDILKSCPEDRPAQFFHRRAGLYITQGVAADWMGVERMESK